MTDDIFDGVRRQLLLVVERVDRDRVRPRFVEDVLEMMFGQVVLPGHPRYAMVRVDPGVGMTGLHRHCTMTSSLRPPPLHEGPAD